MSICDKIKILLESPDQVLTKGNQMTAGYAGSFAFALHSGNFYIGKERGIHSSLVSQEPELKSEYDKKNIEYKKTAENPNWSLDSRGILDYPGRVWTREGIISFWRYPNKLDFKKVLEKLKSKFGSSVDNWKVEVFEGKHDLDDDADANGDLIPVSEYSEKGDKELKNANKPHILSPMLKKKDTSKNSGKKISLPKGMTLAQYHHLTKKESVET